MECRVSQVPGVTQEEKEGLAGLDLMDLLVKLGKEEPREVLDQEDIKE